MNKVQRGLASLLGLEARSVDYTDALVMQMQRSASVPAVGVTATAAAQSCAGLVARSLSTGQVSPETPAITRDVLYGIGVDLILQGTSTWLIDVVGGAVVLHRAKIVETLGKQLGRARYRLELGLPNGEVMEEVYPAESVATFNWATGLAPVSCQAGVALAALETSLEREAALSHGQFMLLPSPGEADTSKAVIDGLSELQGQTGILDIDLSQWAEASMGRSFNFQRLGFSYPPGTDLIYANLCQEVGRSCGVPVGMIGRSDGSALRESYRQFLYTTIEPIGKRIAEELSAKLEVNIDIDFAALAAADISAKARAYKGLIESGLSETQAAQVVGFSLNDEV